MIRKTLFALFSVLLSALLLTQPVLADGIIIPEPPICDPIPCPPPLPPISQLVVKYHHVTVTIQDQVAITRVDQVFYNPNNWTFEGQYIFPLPSDAVVTGFKLWVDGEAVSAVLLDAEQARLQYEEIVRSLRDPALLEYVGSGAVRAKIFPIPAGEERRIELEYTQVLQADNGLVRYLYPLGTEKFSTRPLEEISVNVEINSSQPIRAVYSPSHTVSINRLNDNLVVAGFEASNLLPDVDFALFYSIGETAAFHLLSYRDPTDPEDPDGFFLALIAPAVQPPETTQPKDVLLVLDHSGSMDGEKIQQARQSLTYILQHLNPEDRFNIIGFSTGVETFASGLQPTSQAEKAIRWVNQISAAGSTDINRALLESAAMTQTSRPTYLIFLTDGLPTEGEMDSAKILSNLADNAPANLRLFVFGVGYDVDTFLLDSLAQAHHGTSTYVLPNEALDEVISGFYQKVSTPVLTDLQLDFGSILVSDIYPQPLPDLFQGAQILVLGRYKDGGSTNISLEGSLNNSLQTYPFNNQLFTRDGRDGSTVLASIPRLWAARKIGYLLNLVRLQGPDQELINQIVRLSIRYGIVTPYTSYLVTEPAALGASAQQQIAEDQYRNLQIQPAAPVSGQKAVQDAVGLDALASAESAPTLDSSVSGQVKTIGARTFVLVDGTWTDTAYDPDRMTPIPVSFLSPEYFNLARSSRTTAAALALGNQVLVIVDGTAYKVTENPTMETGQVGQSQTPTPLPTHAVEIEVPPTVYPTIHPTGSPTDSVEIPATPGQQPVAPPFVCPGSAAVVLFAAAVWLKRKFI